MAELTCVLIQAALKWEDKKANLDSFAQKIRNLEPGVHIVFLPEMFSTGFSMRPAELAEPITGASVQWMKDLAREKKLIICGSLIIEENGQYFNRLLWVLPNGQTGWYNKRHLFAYAGEHEQYSAGNERLIASVNGWKIKLLVCYDLRFPVWARQQMSAENGFEYDLLVYLANWPQRRNLAWKTLLRARAIENQCYVIGVNRVGDDGKGISHSGDSSVIDPLGEILYQKEVEEDVFRITLRKEDLNQIREQFPFSRDADQFTITLGNS